MTFLISLLLHPSSSRLLSTSTWSSCSINQLTHHGNRTLHWGRRRGRGPFPDCTDHCPRANCLNSLLFFRGLFLHGPWERRKVVLPGDYCYPDRSPLFVVIIHIPCSLHSIRLTLYPLLPTHEESSTNSSLIPDNLTSHGANFLALMTYEKADHLCKPQDDLLAFTCHGTLSHPS